MIAYDRLDWWLAALPLIAVLGLMVLVRWDAVRAGLAGWVLTVIAALLRFEIGAQGLWIAQARAVILTVDVLLVIWSSLVLYYVVERAGAMDVLARALSDLTQDRLLQALLLAWVFASFLQGVGGFGVPVAIVAPMLVGMGIPAVQAVVLPSIGVSWAVTFGSLAAAFLVLGRVTGIPEQELALPPALMLGALCYVAGLMAGHVLDGWRGVRRVLPFVLVVGSVMAMAQILLVTHGFWTLGATGGAMAGLAVSVGWLSWQSGTRRKRPDHMTGREPSVAAAAIAEITAKSEGEYPSVRLAMVGYAILVGLALLLRGAEPVKQFLAGWALAVDFPEQATGRGWVVPAAPGVGFGIPGHSGLIILYASVITYLIYRRRGWYAAGTIRDILRQSNPRAMRAGMAVFLLVAIAATMTGAGMITILAQGLSESIPGGLYGFVAALIGALGAFVSGTNASSNAFFGTVQATTAELLGLPVLVILGAQTAAASVASVFSPGKLAVGSSTVGANEGMVLRTLIGYGAIMVGLVGLMAWFGTRVL